jgi:glycosyltransferase 2 family protein
MAACQDCHSHGIGPDENGRFCIGFQYIKQITLTRRNQWVGMRKLRLLMKSVLIIITLLFFLFWINWRECLDTLKVANIYWLLAVFVIIHIDRLFMVYKWAILLRKSGTSISASTALKSYYIGSFWGTFLPSSVGGDVVRIGWLIKEVKNRVILISSIIIERIFGALAQAIVAFASFILLTEYVSIRLPMLPRILGLLLLLTIMTVAVLFNGPMYRICKKAMISFNLHRLNQMTEKLEKSMLTFRGKPGLLIIFLGLSISEQVLPVASTFLMAKAFLIDLPLIWAIISVPIILAVSRMPISINSFGVREGAYAFMFSLAGIPISQSVMMSVADRLLLLIATLPGALWTVLPLKDHVLVSIAPNGSNGIEQE